MLEYGGPRSMKKKQNDISHMCQREREREREATFSTGLAVVLCVPATTELGPSLSPSLNPDPWNAADLSCCLFLSSSSSSTAPCLKQQGQDK